jgi:hypothetical protein
VIKHDDLFPGVKGPLADQVFGAQAVLTALFLGHG